MLVISLLCREPANPIHPLAFHSSPLATLARSSNRSAVPSFCLSGLWGCFTTQVQTFLSGTLEAKRGEERRAAICGAGAAAAAS